MEQLVSKITTEILKTMQNQGGVSASFNTAGSVAGMIDHTLLKQNAPAWCSTHFPVSVRSFPSATGR